MPTTARVWSYPDRGGRDWGSDDIKRHVGPTSGETLLVA
jgi:hypothetical protein